MSASRWSCWGSVASRGMPFYPLFAMRKALQTGKKPYHIWIIDRSIGFSTSIPRNSNTNFPSISNNEQISQSCENNSAFSLPSTVKTGFVCRTSAKRSRSMIWHKYDLAQVWFDTSMIWHKYDLWHADWLGRLRARYLSDTVQARSSSFYCGQCRGVWGAVCKIIPTFSILYLYNIFYNYKIYSI